MSTFKPLMGPNFARAQLRSFFDQTPTVYVVQRSVSRSGMNRKLSLFVIVDGQLKDITTHVAALFGERVHGSSWYALNVNGAGMDMHWWTVNRISRKLWDEDNVLKHETL